MRAPRVPFAVVVITAISGALVARADPDPAPRTLVVSALGGASGAAGPDAPVSTVPFVPMLGASLVWERALPRTPLAATAGRVSFAPQASLELHGRRAMALANARLQLSLVTSRGSAVSLWLAPGVGAISGATSPVLGAEMGVAFHVHRAWEVGFVYGIYTWHEPDGTSVALARTSNPTPTPLAPDTQVLQGQLAIVVGHAL
jgi:hypothetical protein